MNRHCSFILNKQTNKYTNTSFAHVIHLHVFLLETLLNMLNVEHLSFLIKTDIICLTA